MQLGEFLAKVDMPRVQPREFLEEVAAALERNGVKEYWQLEGLRIEHLKKETLKDAGLIFVLAPVAVALYI